jgi:hypothetical protein
MICNTGWLRAHLDGALPEAEAAALQVHLASCPRCRQELALLARRGRSVAARLESLEPRPEEFATATAALRRFRTAALAETHERNLSMRLRDFFAGPRRVAVASAAVAICALLLLTLAPVRQAAADFLSVFRVRKFAVIPIDPAQASKLESLADSLGQDAFGKETILREASEPVTVADAAAASSAAGFAVRTPAAMPADAQLRAFTVQVGPATHFQVDRAALSALLDAAGVQDATLPDAETLAFDIDVPAVVTQEYTVDGGKVSLVQVQDPQASFPPGVDPVALGEIGFRLLGMPAEDAQRLAQSIDWTTTVVIPMPTDVGRSREVTVDGVSGVLLEETRTAGYDRTSRVLIWERDGIVYGLSGQGVDADQLLQLADSLR